MNKKILISCYEVPGYGGASTSGYDLFRMLKDTNLDVCYLNIIYEKDVDYYKLLYGDNFGNPLDLPKVYNYILKGSWQTPQPGLLNLLEELTPDINLNIGSPAAFLMSNMDKKAKSIFLTAGCSIVKEAVAKKMIFDSVTLSKLIEKPMYEVIPDDILEKKAVEKSELVITHSYMIRDFFRYFYWQYDHKIYSDVMWFADWIYKSAQDYSNLQKPFSKREIDLLFLVSSWSRPDKNYDYVEKIVTRLKNLSIHIVGEIDKRICNEVNHGFITDRKELFSLLGNSKVIVSPSLFDPAPGILYEASALGCNIVTSKNSGNWQICNSRLLVEDFCLECYIEKINLAIKKRYDDNIDFFLNFKSFDNLVDILSVL